MFFFLGSFHRFFSKESVREIIIIAGAFVCYLVGAGVAGGGVAVRMLSLADAGRILFVLFDFILAGRGQLNWPMDGCNEIKPTTSISDRRRRRR